MASTWLAYNELAWTDDLLVDSTECNREVATYVDLINRTAVVPPRTLLHLGSGAGAQDRFFKQRYAVTGVDISTGMLDRARAANSDVEYIQGDMRSIRLERQFDVVAIPDSIDYMASLSDLTTAIQTAAAHLKTNGVFLVVANVKERFHDSNFAYTAERDGVHVTVFENNYTDPLRSNTYEATLVYLIRQHSQLTIHTDRHLLGLFSEQTWHQAFVDARLSMQNAGLSNAYKKYLLEDGDHQPTIFIGRKE